MAYSGQRKPRGDDPAQWALYNEVHGIVEEEIEEEEVKPVIIRDADLSDEDFFAKYDGDLVKTRERLIKLFPQWLLEVSSRDSIHLYRRSELTRKNKYEVNILTAVGEQAVLKKAKRQPTQINVGDCFYSRKFQVQIFISGFSQAGDELFILVGNRYRIMTYNDLDKMDLQFYRTWGDKNPVESKTIKVRR